MLSEKAQAFKAQGLCVRCGLRAPAWAGSRKLSQCRECLDRVRERRVPQSQAGREIMRNASSRPWFVCCQSSGVHRVGCERGGDVVALASEDARLLGLETEREDDERDED